MQFAAWARRIQRAVVCRSGHRRFIEAGQPVLEDRGLRELRGSIGGLAGPLRRD
jgi:hypothetical protein